MLTEERFRDKVYACWMGKNIGGTLGGPLEGIMELLDVKGYTQEFVTAVENDDLDLQLVNLHCLEQYAGQVTSANLAKGRSGSGPTARAKSPWRTRTAR